MLSYLHPQIEIRHNRQFSACALYRNGKFLFDGLPLPACSDAFNLSFANHCSLLAPVSFENDHVAVELRSKPLPRRSSFHCRWHSYCTE